MKSAITTLSIILALAFIVGCEEKPTLPEALQADAIDTSYVEVTPPFSGFNNPQDILVGNDQLLYVADTYGESTGRIVMMNRAGQILSTTRRILRPIAIAQDSRLDLLVGGVLVATNGDTVGAVFRIRLLEVSHRLDLLTDANVDTVWRELARPERRFPGITVFGENTYLAVRTGSDNSSFVDPDARVLLFDARDNFITPIAGLITRSGAPSGPTGIIRPSGIASFPGVRDFVLVQYGGGEAEYGALWMRYENSPEFEGWLPRFDPARVEDRSRDFIRPNRYLQPEAVAIDRVRRDIFIADAALDSVIKFNSRGNFKSESFGRVRTGGAMVRPTGLAYFERVLYVLDGARGQVLRYRLTTDIPR